MNNNYLMCIEHIIKAKDEWLNKRANIFKFVIENKDYNYYLIKKLELYNAEWHLIETINEIEVLLSEYYE